MLWMGLLALAVNGLSVFILHGGRKENINLKAAYLHMMGDALTSLGVIMGAVAIYTLNWYWVDPLVTLFICGYLLVQTFSILKETVEILMQMAPDDIDSDNVSRAICKIEGVGSVHHIHIWRLSDKKIHFEAHIVLQNDIPVSASHPIRKKIREMLMADFGIDHTTLQFEFHTREITGFDC